MATESRRLSRIASDGETDALTQAGDCLLDVSQTLDGIAEALLLIERRVCDEGGIVLLSGDATKEVAPRPITFTEAVSR